MGFVCTEFLRGEFSPCTEKNGCKTLLCLVRQGIQATGCCQLLLAYHQDSPLRTPTSRPPRPCVGHREQHGADLQDALEAQICPCLYMLDEVREGVEAVALVEGLALEFDEQILPSAPLSSFWPPAQSLRAAAPSVASECTSLELDRVADTCVQRPERGGLPGVVRRAEAHLEVEWRPRFVGDPPKHGAAKPSSMTLSIPLFCCTSSRICAASAICSGAGLSFACWHMRHGRDQNWYQTGVPF